jgi:nitrogen fixation NifU-like protein
MDSDMYRQEMIEVYKNPEHKGELKNATVSCTEFSPTCGDKITVQLKISNDKIEDAKFSGSGCVISVVTSDMLVEKIIGMNIEDVKSMTSQEVLDMLKINLSPARIKCALVCFAAIKKAIK